MSSTEFDWIYKVWKRLKSTTLDDFKKIVEIFAIIAAGLFAFFTWGYDYYSVSQPSWEISIENVNQNLAIENREDTINVFISIADNDEKKDFWKDTATSLIFQGAIKVENKGKRKIDLRETRIDVFFLKREKSKGIVDVSLYKYYKMIDSDDPDTSLKIVLNAIDSLSVFPGTSGNRPFAFELNPSKLKGIEIPLREFSRKYVMMLKGTQIIERKNFLNKVKRDSSRIVFLASNLGYIRDVEIRNPIVNDST